MIQSSWCLERNKTNSPKMTIRFTSMICPTFDPVVITNLTCFIKAYSRTQSTANFGYMISKNLMKLILKAVVEYKYGTVFREGNQIIELCVMISVMSPPRIDWCSFNKGSSGFYTMYSCFLFRRWQN